MAIEVRNNCVFCKRYKAKLIQVEIGKVHDTRLCIAPAFWHVQIDILGPFVAHCEHNHRSSVKVWGLVFKDPGSGALSVHCMQDYSSSAFVLAYTRFACRFGHPYKIFIDPGTQLVKGCSDMSINLTDITDTLNGQYGVKINFEVCPPGAHNYQGCVERSIQEIKKLFHSVYRNLKLDVLAFETAFAWVSNELNNLPIALGSKTDNLDNVDLITPSRLIFGRNNQRAPYGPCQMVAPSRLIKQMSLVYDSWWKVWKSEKLIDFIPQPRKWQKTTYQPLVGDIVVFSKDDIEQHLGTVVWRLGRVIDVIKSSDNLIREVRIQYKNVNETVFRETKRSVRQIAVVHSETDLQIVDVLNEAAKKANID